MPITDVQLVYRWVPFLHVQDPAIALLAADYLSQLRTAAEAHLAVLASRKFSTDPRTALAMRLPAIVATADAIVEASDSLLSAVDCFTRGTVPSTS